MPQREEATISLEDVLKAIIVDSNLNPIAQLYDEYNDLDKKIIETVSA